MTLRLAAALLALTAPALAAQQAPRPIQDNSFLLEEAYNQEPGVVQHISLFTREAGGSWRYAFTQEWPVSGQRHQFSYTLLLQRTAGAPARTGLGDAALNYRFQAAGSGATPVAVAPRLSVLLPTGDPDRSLGAGSVGVQVNLPVSWVLSPRLVTHWNAGTTWLPHARDAAGDRAATTSLNLGQSIIVLLTGHVNLMLETAWTRDEAVAGPAAVAAAHTLFVSPGIRVAIDHPSGLQVVPGLALPIGIGPSRGATALVAYLSFEHPYTRQPAGR